jgi:hypothetical protein
MKPLLATASARGRARIRRIPQRETLGFDGRVNRAGLTVRRSLLVYPVPARLVRATCDICGSSSRSEPMSLVNIKLHRAVVSHLQ